MIKISVIIVNYNVKPFLERALLSIRKAVKGISSEVIVVDNGSGDGSVQMVRERFPEVHIIENEKNVGFAKANNQALRKVRGKNVCLINPDTLVQDDTFQVCLDYLDTHSDVGVVGCKILNADGTLQLACRRSFPMPWVAFTKMVGLSRLFPGSKLFGRYNLTYLDPDETVEVEAISGSFMVVRKQVVEEVGLLDEEFFLYGEDLDWCYRIGQAGWKIVYLPQTQIIHYKGQSTREAPFDSFRIFFGAMHLFVKKHFKKGWSFFPRWFIMAGIWVWEVFSFLSRLLSRLIVPLVDVVFLQLGLVIALLIRFGDMHYWPRYRIINVIYTLIWIGCLYAMGLYKRRIYFSSKVLSGVMTGLILNTSFTFFFPMYAFSRQVILVAGALDGLFLGGWRLILRSISHVRRIPLLGKIGKKLVRRRAVIVGADLSGHRILNKLKSHINVGYEVVGILGLDDRDLVVSGNGQIPVLGTLNDLERIAPVHQIQEVIFSPEAVNSHRILNVVASEKNRHLDYKMMPRDLDLVIGRTSIESLEDIPLVDLDYKIYSEPNRFFKRIMDLIIVVILMPFIIPILLYILCHPSLHLRRWVISDGTGLSLSVWQPYKNGKIISGWLNRVPLFLEILKGRMSLVGTEIVPFDGSALGKGFKPGLTGLVQVNSTKKGLKEDEKVVYNLYYLRNYSILLDLEIIWRALFGL